MNPESEQELLSDDLPLVKQIEGATVFEKRAIGIKTFCQAFIVNDQLSFTIADRKIVEASTLKKAISEHHQKPIASARQSWTDAKEARDSIIKPIDEGTDALARKMATWKDYEEAKRDEEIRKAETEAKAKHQAACLEEAERLEKEGADEEAIDAILDFADEPPTIKALVQQEVRSKTSLKKKWAFKITNPKLIPREFCKPDESLIRAQVKATGERTQIAGVFVFQDHSIRKYSEQ